MTAVAGPELAPPAVARDRTVVRLRRIEGQVRGLQRMLDAHRSGIDVLTQIAAVHAALDKVALAVLAEETDRCLTAPDERAASARREELLTAIARMRY